MATNQKQDGTRMTWTNGTGSDVSSGDAVVVEGRVFIAMIDIADGAIGELAAKGVWEVNKRTDEAFVQGKDLYYDTTQELFTHVVGANIKAGYAHASATAAASVGNVNIQQ